MDDPQIHGTIEELVAAGGIVALIGIENPRRVVSAEGCPGGQFAGAPRAAAAAHR